MIKTNWAKLAMMIVLSRAHSEHEKQFRSTRTQIKNELASDLLWVGLRRAKKYTELLQLVQATAMMKLE
jgi:hypothetical protein